MKEENNKQTRIRRYGSDYKGEIIVFIHASGDGLKLEPIYKTLFKNFENISQITVVNKNKIKVLFEEKGNRKKALLEANTLAEAKLNGCYIYIPAKYVEVQGVVSWPVSENIDDFVSSGKGLFNNPLMKEIKVLESIRLKKKSNDTSNEPQLEDTSIVIISFEGNLLPDKLNLDKLIIPVREYRRREMFCLNCKKYGHTQKMCNNKKLESPTYLCMQCCNNDHFGGSNQCPRRKVLEKKHMITLRKLRKRTFAEMLKELDPAAEVHDTPVDTTVQKMSFPTRKEEVAQKQVKKSEAIAQKQPKASKATTKPPTSSSTVNKYPPGFKKPSNTQPQSTIKNYDDVTQSVIEVIEILMKNMNVPLGLQQIIVTHAAPYIDTFFRNLTDTIQNKISEFCGN